MRENDDTTKRAALYLRVSTEGQTTDNQRPDLERLARARGYDVVAVYQEQESAAKRRPAHARMLDDARRGAFNVLVVWALDRFGRSMAGNVRQVLELDRLGVLVVSTREPWLDTSGPVRDLLVAIFSWVAEQERSRLVERTKAGLARARREGKRLGRRRRMAGSEVGRALALRAEGRSVRAIAVALKVPRSTLARALSQKRVASLPTNVGCE